MVQHGGMEFMRQLTNSIRQLIEAIPNILQIAAYIVVGQLALEDS